MPDSSDLPPTDSTWSSNDPTMSPFAPPLPPVNAPFSQPMPGTYASVPGSNYPTAYAPYPPPVVAPLVPVPLPPVTTRRGPLGAILASVTVLTLVAAFGALLVLRPQGPNTNTTAQDAQAQQILSRAAQVHLRDTKINVTLTTSGNITGTSTSSMPTALTETGSLAITSKPFRMHIIMHITSPGISNSTASLTIEEIITSDAVYRKLPRFPGEPRNTKLWHKSSIPSGLGASGLGDSSILDFSHLTHPHMIGEEIINGRKTWHVRATLGDLLNGNPSEAATATAIGSSIPEIKNLNLVEDLWIIEANNFPAQLKIHESANGAVPTGGYGTTTTGTATLLSLHR